MITFINFDARHMYKNWSKINAPSWRSNLMPCVNILLCDRLHHAHHMRNDWQEKTRFGICVFSRIIPSLKIRIGAHPYDIYFRIFFKFLLELLLSYLAKRLYHSVSIWHSVCYSFNITRAPRGFLNLILFKLEEALYEELIWLEEIICLRSLLFVILWGWSLSWS